MNKFNKSSYKNKIQSVLIPSIIVFVIALLFSLQPLLNLQWKSTLNAGQMGNGNAFANAPVTTIAGGQALISQSGVNASVLQDLLSVVNNENVWSGKSRPTENTNVYLTAQDFANYTTNEVKKNKYRQIVLQLFDSSGVSSNYSADSASAMKWQVVYRSVGADADVLTLYMIDQYATSAFDNGNAQNSYNGGEQTLRKFVLNTYSELSSNFGSNLTNYVVLPTNIPDAWQSESQSGSSYDINSALTAEDVMWVPSTYETLRVNNGTASSLTDSNGDGFYDTITDEGANVAGRTGLWKLNAYDRSTGNFAWLRSGSALSGGENIARGIREDGYTAGHTVNINSYGVRVALHINLKALAKSILSQNSTVPFTQVKLSVDLQNNNTDLYSVNILEVTDEQSVVRFQKSFVKQEEITFDLINNAIYFISVSKPYLSQVAFSGEGKLVNNDCYQFIPSQLSTPTITITVNGITGDIENRIVI